MSEKENKHCNKQLLPCDICMLQCMEYLVTQGRLGNGLEEIRTTNKMSEITLFQ